MKVHLTLVTLRYVRTQVYTCTCTQLPTDDKKFTFCGCWTFQILGISERGGCTFCGFWAFQREEAAHFVDSRHFRERRLHILWMLDISESGCPVLVVMRLGNSIYQQATISGLLFQHPGLVVRSCDMPRLIINMRPY